MAALAIAALTLAPAAGAKSSQRGLFWGAWIGTQLTGTQPPWDMSAVAALEQRLGKGLSTIQFGVPFADCSVSPCSFYKFPSQEMETIRRYGAVPFLSWSSQATPWVMGNPEPDFQLGDVISGTYDSYIREFAEAAKAWGHPYFMRFNWEPNGDWFPWARAPTATSQGSTSPPGATCTTSSPRSEQPTRPGSGARTSTSTDSPRSPASTPATNTSTGAASTATTGPKPAARPVPWKSFDQIFADSYRQIVTKIAPKKPMLLAELASSGGGRAKAEWIDAMFKSLKTKFRRVRGLIWFDQVQQGVSWPLENSPLVAQAFASGLRHPSFRANLYGSLATTPIPPPR